MQFPPLSIDLDFSHAVQQYQSDWLTYTMRAVSSVIDPMPLTLLGLMTVAYLYIKKHDRHTIAVIVCLTIGNILTPLLKNVFLRPRPTSDLVDILAKETDFSFPSGHAIAAVILGGIIVVLSKRLANHHQRLWMLVALLVMLLVGYSRVYLGVHWLSDVLAGYSIGLLWCVLTYRLIPSPQARKESS